MAEPMVTRPIARKAAVAFARRPAIGCLVVLVVFVVIVVAVLVGLPLLLRYIQRGVAPVRVPLIVGGATLSALWLGALGVVRFVRRPRIPDPGPSTMDLRPESPAVANLLVSGFRVTREALPATLLDLAARGALDIQGHADGPFTVCITGKVVRGLRPHEQRILELLERRARDGVIPARALTSGPRARARTWWRSFRKEVVGEAKQAGLSRDLWDVRIAGTLGILAVPAGILWSLSFRGLQAPLLYGFGVFTILAVLVDSGRQRDTDAGLVAAAAWLGTFRHLKEDQALEDLPPTAVAVWERILPYAAAFGLARTATRAFPLGADPDHRAWSSYGGRWREVRIRYPSMWPPAWGASTWAAILGGLVGGAIAAGMLWVAWKIGAPLDLLRSTEELTRFAGWVSLGFLVGGLAFGAWSLIVLVLGLGDLSGRKQVTGEVLRMRERGGDDDHQPRYYVAIDDGTRDSIRAWKVSRDVYATPGLVEYEDATATVTPRLGRVLSIVPLTPGSPATTLRP